MSTPVDCHACRDIITCPGCRSSQTSETILYRQHMPSCSKRPRGFACVHKGCKSILTTPDDFRRHLAIHHREPCQCRQRRRSAARRDSTCTVNDDTVFVWDAAAESVPDFDDDDEEDFPAAEGWEDTKVASGLPASVEWVYWYCRMSVQAMSHHSNDDEALVR